MKNRLPWALLGAFGLVFVCGGARAQSLAPLLDWQNSAGIVLRSLGGPIPDWEVTLGGGGGVLPAYEGSNSLRFAPALLLDVRYRATSQQGFVGDVGVYMPVVGTKSVQVFVGPSVTLADDRYMNAYFGVSPRHAAPHSQFHTFEAHGGLKNANFGLTALYHFTDHWFVDVDAGIERLLGSAVESPLTQTKWGIGANASIAYTF